MNVLKTKDRAVLTKPNFQYSSFNIKFQFKVSIPSFNVKFQLQVSISRFNFKFPFHVSILSFNFKFQFQDSISKFNSNLELLATHSSDGMHGSKN